MRRRQSGLRRHIVRLALLRRWKAWVFGEQGFVLVFLAVAIPAILALAGLVLDGTRLLSLDAELANRADAAALAAANQLDRSEGAIEGARRAAAALADGGAGVRLSFRFAADLASLERSHTFSLAEASSREAAFVEVTASTQRLSAYLLGLVGIDPPLLRRRSIAESQYYACDVTPAVLCHSRPDEFAAEARPGRHYLLRMNGSTATGSLALLDRPNPPGRRDALVTLASDVPAFCYADAVRLRTDAAAAEFDEAINVRFDRYTGRAGPISPDLADFPPAPNVIQGRHFESCASPPQGGDINPPYGLPRDLAYQGVVLRGLWNAGTGDWRTAPPLGGTGLAANTALDEYVAWNHGDKGPDILDRIRGARTRWELYLAELGLTTADETRPVDTRSLGASVATMPTGGPSSGSLALRRERAFPICYGGNRPATQARRRILYLSIANCEGFERQATAKDLSRNVGKFFLTEPSELGATLVEFVGLIRPRADDGKLRHVVQLVAAD